MAYSFKNDYSEGCHPFIIDALLKSNSVQQEGYGGDEYSVEAIRLIRGIMNNEKADVHFVSGGTQSNLIVIGALLKPYESVVCAATGHIHIHEAGSIEATGHKINAIETKDGKLTPQTIQEVLDFHSDVPHMVKPGMVYISNSTEIGTIYKKKELEDLFLFCRQKKLFLFMDGARLGSALCAADSDLTLSDISQLTDVFYIGGTKNGAMLGEAIVINNELLKEDFAYHLKQRGALLAKGRFLGMQFRELFKHDLFFQLARHANAMAQKIASACAKRGCVFLSESSSNQIFPVLPNSAIEKLLKKYEFYIWKKGDDDHSAIRMVTSWATPENKVDEFIADLNEVMGNHH